MRIVVGLGNPGEKYQKNRHNVGFLLVDLLHQFYDFATWQQKFQAKISQGMIGRQKILLIKPQSFMNLSGQPVGEILRFYKQDVSSLLVAHDDLDLKFAQIKVKTGGGNGGHNGLRSIDSHCGNDYQRLRFGISRPENKDQVSDYVLHDFSAQEWHNLQEILTDIARNFPLLLQEDINQFIQKLNVKD